MAPPFTAQTLYQYYLEPTWTKYSLIYLTTFWTVLVRIWVLSKNQELQNTRGSILRLNISKLFMLEVGATFRTFQSVLQKAFEKRWNGNSWYFFDLTVAAASEFDLPSAIHYYILRCICWPGRLYKSLYRFFNAPKNFKDTKCT